MSQKTWKHPELGSFRHANDYGVVEWKGTVELPAFSVFRYRGLRPFRGSKRISVVFCSNDEDFVPSKKLAGLVLKIIKNQDKLAKAIKTAFHDSVLGLTSKHSSWWTDCPDVIHSCGQVLLKHLKRETIESPDDFNFLLGEPGITIWGNDYKPVAGIGLGTAMEDDHGIEVVTDGPKILGIGNSGHASNFISEPPKSESELLQVLETPQLWSIFGCENRAVQKSAIKRAGEQLNLLRQKSNRSPREKFVTGLVKLVSLLRVASKSTSAKYESLLGSCLDDWKLLGKPKSVGVGRKQDVVESRRERDIVDCHRHLLSLIGNGPKKRAKRLIEARQSLPAEYFDFVANAGRKWMKSADFFETFSPYVKAGTKKSAAHTRSRLLNTCLLFRGISPQKRLDKRWLDVAFKHNNEVLICELANRAHQKSMDFLQAQWESNKKQKPHELFTIIESLARSKHPLAKEAFLATAEWKVFAKRTDRDWIRWTSLLKHLPKSAPEHLKQLLEHPKCTNEQTQRDLAHYITVHLRTT